MSTLDERARSFLAAQVSQGKLDYPRRAKDDPQDSHSEVLKAAWWLLFGFGMQHFEAMSALADFCSRGQGAWTDRELEHKLRAAEKNGSSAERGFLLKERDFSKPSGPPPMVKAPVKKVERAEWSKVNREAVAQFVAGVPELDFAWFSRRSPVDVASVGTGEFLSALFGYDERVLIFTNYYSQGDFIFWRGEFFRLSAQEDVKAVRCEPPNVGPKSGKKGVWYLVQPVSGRWEIGDRVKDGKVLKTRRSEANVVSWRHFVLESDEKDFEALWLKVVAKLTVPISAIYTSGGRSIHALLKFPCDTKAMWDATKARIQQVVCQLGADPGALSAVRLSRLPGCLREGTDDKDGRYVRYSASRMQQLIYLNPTPTFESIFASPELRS